MLDVFKIDTLSESNEGIKVELDSIFQIAHGSLFGWNETLNYLKVEVNKKTLTATIKEIGNTPIREGRKSLGILINDSIRTQGFQIKGKLIIDKSQNTTKYNKLGCFAER